MEGPDDRPDGRTEPGAGAAERSPGARRVERLDDLVIGDRQNRYAVAALDDVGGAADGAGPAPVVSLGDLGSTGGPGPEPVPVALFDTPGRARRPARVASPGDAPATDRRRSRARRSAEGRPAAGDAGGPAGDGRDPADIADAADTALDRDLVAGDRRRRPRRSGRDADPSDERPGRGGSGGRAAGWGRPGAGAAELDPDADPESVARSICLRLLTDRARTRQELAQALRKRGVPDEAAARVLDRFGEVGLIDDAAFAGQYVRSRHTYRGLGRRAIAAELRRKGVDDETAGEALAEVDSEAEAQRARELVDRKLRTQRGEVDEAVARRLLGMLARKGYPSGIAYRVVREALAEQAAELAEQLPSGEDD